MFGWGQRPRRMNLALQGGGAHGAFTWGVLDALLEEPRFEPAWISGTSAGAINAVALASGLAKGGRDEARATLKSVWTAVGEAGVPDLLKLNPFLFGISRSRAMGQVASLFSPSEFNPLRFDPLRKLLLDHIDFDRLRSADGPELLIAATDVATARGRIFRRRELTLEAVLASTCLPTLHHAVVIDGRAYWDGGFSANPELLTLAAQSPVEDTLIVLLNPVEQPSMPRSAREISAEVSRVTFTQPLLRDITEIVTLQAENPPKRFARRTRAKAIGRHRFHLVEAGRHTGALSPDSKLHPDKAMLALLHNAGREEARKWLGRSFADVGRRSTIDLGKHFLGEMSSLAVVTPARDTADDETESSVPSPNL